MNILHLDLKPRGNDYVEFRYFWDNPNNFQSHQRSITQLEELIQQTNTEYNQKLNLYSVRNRLGPEDYARVGQVLYKWLDGSKRNLQRAINQHRREFIVLAISTSKNLADLPWEVLHDGESFLVQRRPTTIIPLRWVKDPDEKQLTFENEPANRALNLLFMATSPLGIEPELDFEAEERRILEATRRKPLSLIVEESGCLKELVYLVEDYEENYFDVLHLTGHATVKDKDKIPCFITETEFGEAEYSSAEDIAEDLKYQLPKLIFLSGCRTGESIDQGTVPSMAENLLRQGATAVLGWGHKVLDTDATRASATLYQELSAGKTLVEAVALTYQVLLKNHARDWHLLRLYVSETIPGALVKRGYNKPVPRPVVEEFLDPEKKLRVATRETFVGRRRQLQNCLRTLKTPSEKIGVLIYGMGGLGKSTIASRLCVRLSKDTTLVWWRQIDESSFVNKLADKLRNSQQRTAIKESTEELKYRLRDIFETLNQPEEQPFLLVFDDFEWNLEPREGRYVLNPQVREVLSALVWAIQETYTNHRIIITCRYDFELDILQSLYKQPLEAFQKSQLQKYLTRLENFDKEKVDEELIKRALKLADGNPRLLEWLNKEVLPAEDADLKLSQDEASPRGWKEKIIWELENQPKLQLDETIEKLTSYCLVYNIPIPRQALEAVCDSISGYKEQLERAIKLGLIEVSPEREESNRVYRVSRILPHIIPTIRLPQAPEVDPLYRKAHEKLHKLWRNQKNTSEEKWGEIFRLLFAVRDNPERFRQGFSKMLAVQYNPEADRAFEAELRLSKEELPKENLTSQLEDYLRQGDWRKADEETAWLFYLVMVQQGYPDWYELCNEFPSETLNEIDRLWVDYSQGHFGFSIQKRIYWSVGRKPDQPNVIFTEKFYKQVEWVKDSREVEYNSLPFSREAGIGNLPALWRTHFPSFLGGWRLEGVAFFNSLLENPDLTYKI
ncbi:MAG: GUN4 domain-containing protein [Xenococcaceae cyanobacterium MO_188.B29]|nr:GUN4 domain-containing protein [Xenococcaceae cyanobacterium MO_188.B29]